MQRRFIKILDYKGNLTTNQQPSTISLFIQRNRNNLFLPTLVGFEPLSQLYEHSPRNSTLVLTASQKQKQALQQILPIKCYIDAPQCKDRILEINPFLDVGWLRQYIQKQENTVIKIVINNRQLTNPDEVLMNHIYPNVIIHFIRVPDFAQENVSIRVKEPLQLQQQLIQNLDTSLKIEDLIEIVGKRVEIPVERLYLAHRGKILSKKKHISSYHIQNFGLILALDSDKYMKILTRVQYNELIKQKKEQMNPKLQTQQKIHKEKSPFAKVDRIYESKAQMDKKQSLHSYSQLPLVSKTSVQIQETLDQSGQKHQHTISKSVYNNSTMVLDVDIKLNQQGQPVQSTKNLTKIEQITEKDKVIKTEEQFVYNYRPEVIQQKKYQQTIEQLKKQAEEIINETYNLLQFDIQNPLDTEDYSKIKNQYIDQKGDKHLVFIEQKEKQGDLHIITRQTVKDEREETTKQRISIEDNQECEKGSLYRAADIFQQKEKTKIIQTKIIVDERDERILHQYSCIEIEKLSKDITKVQSLTKVQQKGVIYDIHTEKYKDNQGNFIEEQQVTISTEENLIGDTKKITIIEKIDRTKAQQFYEDEDGNYHLQRDEKQKIGNIQTKIVSENIRTQDNQPYRVVIKIIESDDEGEKFAYSHEREIKNKIPDQINLQKQNKGKQIKTYQQNKDQQEEHKQHKKQSFNEDKNQQPIIQKDNNILSNLQFDDEMEFEVIAIDMHRNEYKLMVDSKDTIEDIQKKVKKIMKSETACKLIFFKDGYELPESESVIDLDINPGDNIYFVEQ